MDDTSARNLRHAAQLLALPVTFQMQVEVAGDRVRALGRPFMKRAAAVAADVAGLRAAAIAAVLARLAAGPELAVCDDLALRRCHAWCQVREAARQLLVVFGWPLAIPPAGAIVYSDLKGEPRYDSRTSVRPTGYLSDHSVRPARSGLVNLV